MNLPKVPEEIILDTVRRRLGAATNTTSIQISPYEIPIVLNAISEYLKIKALGQYLHRMDTNQYTKQ